MTLLTLLGTHETLVLLMYSAIGFFGAIGLALSGVGITIYMLRLGTEHRVEGIATLAKGIKVLFFVVLAIFVFTVFIE
jgi:hypothetical protein